MQQTAQERTLECVTCGKRIAASDTSLYEKLEFFDDVCYCKDCLTHEREGSRPANA